MAATVYRYKHNGPPLADISRCVPGALVLGTLSPTPYLDVTADSLYKADLDDFMATKGFTFDSASPVTTPAQSAAGSDANRRLLEKFISAPAEGWPSNIYREITGSPFISNVAWWTDSSKSTKIVDVTYTRNAANQATTIVWKMYAANGTTILSTITDTVVYADGAETSRTRVSTP